MALRTVLRDATNNPGRDIPVCGDDDAVGWILMIVRLQLHLLLAAWDAYSWKLVIDVCRNTAKDLTSGYQILCFSSIAYRRRAVRDA